MLVLTRKSQQRIRIGDNITISILKVKGNSVSLGIEAPRDVRVVRGELAPLGGTPADDLSNGEAPTQQTGQQTVQQAAQQTTDGQGEAAAVSGVAIDERSGESSAADEESHRPSLRDFIQRRRPGSDSGRLANAT